MEFPWAERAFFFLKISIGRLISSPDGVIYIQCEIYTKFLWIYGLKARYEDKELLNNVLIYNPKCSKSRKAVELVDDKKLSIEKRNYLENPLKIGELKSLLDILGCSVNEIIRSKETAYSEMNLKDSSEDQILEAIEKTPILLERPIVILNGKGVVARPPEKLEQLF